MKRVLVVEADAVSARRMGSFWETVGFEARIVTEAGRAAHEAALWRPDLITVDVEGIDMDGADLLRQLQSRPQTSRIPVVLLSPEDHGRLPDVLLRGVRLVLDKPFQLDRLLNGLSDVIHATAV